MKRSQANELIEQVRLKFSPNKEVSEIDLKGWQAYLLTLNYKLAAAAIERMFHCETNTYGAFPFLTLLKNNVDCHTESTCPCCGGGGWLSWWVLGSDGRLLADMSVKSSYMGKADDAATPCHCKSRKERDGIEGLCKNIHCTNKEKLNRLVVPPKQGGKIRASMRNCIYNPSVTESKNWNKRDVGELGV
jgi:hypothetical protein